MKFKLLFLSVFLLVQCTPSRNYQSNSLLSFTPVKLAALLKTNDFETFKNAFKNNSFVGQFTDQPEFEKLKATLVSLEHFNTEDQLIIAFSDIEKTELDFLLVQQNTSKNPFVKDSLTGESIPYENKTITKYSLGLQNLYSTEIQSFQLLSSSQLLIENAIRTQGKNKLPGDLKNLYELSNKTQLLLPLEKGFWFSQQSLAIMNKEKVSQIGKWSALELELNPDSFLLNGVITTNDSIQTYLNLFKGMRNSKSYAAQYAPFSTEQLWTYAINEYPTFDTNRSNYLKRTVIKDTLFNKLMEVACFNFSQNQVVMLRIQNSEEVFKKISEELSEYQEIVLGKLNRPNLLKENLWPVISNTSFTDVCLVDDVILFSENADALKTIISAKNTQATFDKSAAFSTAMSLMSDQSTISFIGKELTDLYDFEKSKEQKNQVVTAQWVGDQGFYHKHFGMKKMSAEKRSKKITPLFHLKLDRDIQYGPILVLNHRTKQKEILVQDVANNLYLIDNKGKLLWKKGLDAPIKGAIHQVDIYRNGRLQYAFTIENQFLVVDRNGNKVNDFTLHFKDGNLGPLAVFDYDGSRQYRFVITQGNEVFMIDNKGNRVKGFTFTKASQDIIGTPVHFRIKNKDLLLFKLADGTLKILNRRGRERIKTQGVKNLSLNNLYLHQNKITTTTRQGELLQIDADGKVSSKDLKVSNLHKIDATSKTLAVMDGNFLWIKGLKATLPLGEYTAPKIFYLYDTLYICTTNLETSQVYVYNSKAELIKEFPIYGSNSALIDDLNRDRKIELLTQDGTDGIVVYQLP